jgi:hypothetical protein
MEGMVSYTQAAVERAMKVQEVILRGICEEDYLVASGGDRRNHRPADASSARALRRIRL